MTARLWPVRHGLIRFRLIEHHIEKLAHARLCDGGPAGTRDISSEVLFTLIAKRYERRYQGITSNLVFSEWKRIFANPIATPAAIDRVVHHSVMMEFDLHSYRTNAAQNRQEEKASHRQNLLTHPVKMIDTRNTGRL